MDGDFAKARTVVESIADFETMRTKYRNGANVTVVKEALQIQGFGVGKVRLPGLPQLETNDRETLQKEMMELYKTEKANPLMGCLPMFLQVPVFLGLFHVLRRLNPDNTLTTLYGWSEALFKSASGARLFTAPLSSKFGSTATELAALDANGTRVKIIAVVVPSSFLAVRDVPVIANS